MGNYYGGIGQRLYGKSERQRSPLRTMARHIVLYESSDFVLGTRYGFGKITSDEAS